MRVVPLLSIFFQKENKMLDRLIRRFIKNDEVPNVEINDRCFKICDRCGKIITDPNLVHEIKFVFRYGSPLDGEVHSMLLCDDCAIDTISPEKF